AILTFIYQDEDGIRNGHVTGVQTCALPISDTDGQTAQAPGPNEPPADEAAEQHRASDRQDRPHDGQRAAGADRPGPRITEWMARSEERRVGTEGRCRRGPGTVTS